MTTAKLQLERYFFPHQEVRANPAHDPAGNRGGTRTETRVNTWPIEGRPDAFAAECIIGLDEAASENPVYFYTIHVFGVFVVLHDSTEEESMKVAANTAITMLIGAARERLAELTARAPWGVLFLDTVYIQNTPSVAGADS